MAKLDSSFKNMVLVLGAVALVAAFLLSFVHMLTIDPIEKARLAKQQQAIRDVLPAYDSCNDPELINGLPVYKAYKQNNFVGAAVIPSTVPPSFFNFK